MFEKLFHLMSSFNASIWLDDTFAFNKLTKEVR